MKRIIIVAIILTSVVACKTSQNSSTTSTTTTTEQKGEPQQINRIEDTDLSKKLEIQKKEPVKITNPTLQRLDNSQLRQMQIEKTDKTGGN